MFSLSGTIWRVSNYAVGQVRQAWNCYAAVVVYIYETLLLMLDTGLYYVMNCVLMTLALADSMLEFSDKVTNNVQLARKVFQHQMYNNVN